MIKQVNIFLTQDLHCI